MFLRLVTRVLCQKCYGRIKRSESTSALVSAIMDTCEGEIDMVECKINGRHWPQGD